MYDLPSRSTITPLVKICFVPRRAMEALIDSIGNSERSLIGCCKKWQPSCTQRRDSQKKSSLDNSLHLHFTRWSCPPLLLMNKASVPTWNRACLCLWLNWRYVPWAHHRIEALKFGKTAFQVNTQHRLKTLRMTTSAERISSGLMECTFYIRPLLHNIQRLFSNLPSILSQCNFSKDDGPAQSNYVSERAGYGD